MMTTTQQEGTTLSVERVFRVLEVLSERKSPMTLTEISYSLDLAKSSALKLLRGMTHLGYLTEDPRAKTYFPSLKVCQLGRAVETLLIGHHDHISMLEELRDVTEESVSLAMQQGNLVEFSDTLQGPQPLAFNATKGMRYPIYISAAGRVMLADMPEHELERLAKRITEHPYDQYPAFDYPTFLKDAAEIRKQGFATTHPNSPGNVMSIAKLLPTPLKGRRIAVSVGGPRDRMAERRDWVVNQIDKIIERYYTEN